MPEILSLIEAVTTSIDPLPAVAIVLIAGFFMRQTQNLAITTAVSLGSYWVAYVGQNVLVAGESFGTVIDLTMEQFLSFRVSTLMVYFLFFGISILTIFTVKTVLQR